MTDPELETAIEEARLAFSQAREPLKLQAAWQRLKSLLEQRSDTQVRYMEEGIFNGGPSN